MKGLDVTVVRFMPFIMFLFIGHVILNAWNGNHIIEAEFLFGNSMIYSIGMFIVSISNKKYHCVWNRAMYALLITIPAINYIDYKLNIFQEAEQQLYVLSLLWAATAITTGYLAINSFFIKRINKIWSSTSQKRKY